VNEPSDNASRDRRPHVVYDDWMSDSDALMWHIERDPMLRSTVLSAWILDRAPDDARFRATLERTERMVPRLHQRVVEDPLGVAAPRWEADPFFDVDYHVRRLRCPGNGTMREFLDLGAPVMMQAFDKDRPLWELHCVDGLEGGRCGIMMKVHHAMSDGVGMVRMTEGLVERSRDARHKVLAPEDREDTVPVERGELFQIGGAVLHRASTALDRGRRAAAAVGRGLSRAAGHPLETAGELLETLESVGRLVRPASEPMSPLWRARSLSQHLDVLEFPLDALKSAARAADCTLNDVFVGAVAGGLARHHEQLGAPVDALRMSMPINLRSGEGARTAGNQFVPARFAVPTDIKDPRKRLQVIHDLVRRQRDEPGLGLTQEISAAINVLGEAAATRVTGAMMKALDFVTSNVPGPPFPVYMSGARIERMYPFGPTAGAAVNITLFSYDGIAGIGITADRAAVGDTEALAGNLRAGFHEVMALG
jgi:diacylglycerol O-acyltransferase